MTEQDIRALWAYAGRLWRQFPIAETSQVEKVDLMVWQRNLGDLDTRTVMAALDALSGRDFPPPPGMVRAKALELGKRADGWKPAPSAAAAWAEILEVVDDQLRSGSHLPYSHPAVACAVKTLSWSSLRTEEASVLRAHFLRLWPDIAARFDHGGDPEAPGVLAAVGVPTMLEALEERTGRG